MGEFPPLTPRGLAVFLRGGLADWMSACPPRERPKQPRSPAGPSAAPRDARALPATSAELVGLLAEMALASQRRCTL